MCDEANMESLGIEDYADSREFAWVMEVPYIHRTLGLVTKIHLLEICHPTSHKIELDLFSGKSATNSQL